VVDFAAKFALLQIDDLQVEIAAEMPADRMITARTRCWARRTSPPSGLRSP
jgi:hypothetical protein